MGRYETVGGYLPSLWAANTAHRIDHSGRILNHVRAQRLVQFIKHFSLVFFGYALVGKCTTIFQQHGNHVRRSVGRDKAPVPVSFFIRHFYQFARDTQYF